jgi:hypothetical protein
MSTPWWFFLIAAGLIVMSGFFSGLNLGLMSLAPDELKVVMEGSADDDVQLDVALEERLLRFDVGGGDRAHRGVGGHCACVARAPLTTCGASTHSEAQASESSRFYAARGALLMRLRSQVGRGRRRVIIRALCRTSFCLFDVFDVSEVLVPA